MGKSNISHAGEAGTYGNASVNPEFGQDAGAPAPAGPAPAAAPGGTVPGAGAPVPLPPGTTLPQAVAKAQAAAAANAVVSTDPNAIHSVKILGSAPTVWGSTAAGAALGSAFLPGPGTLIGAGIGFAAERYQIAGGPFGRSWRWLKSKVVKTT